MGGGGVRRNEETLRRDSVVGDGFSVHTCEGAGSDMQQDFLDGDAALPEPVQEAFGEMETCGRRGDASGFVRIDGLISLAVEGAVRAADVGGQRKMAKALKEIENRRPTFKDHGARSIGMDGRDSTGLVFAKGDDGPDAKLAARPHQRPKLVGTGGLWKEVQNFRVAAAPGVAEEPGGKNATSVDDQQIAVGQEVGQIRKRAVLDRPAGSAKHHEAGRVAARERLLRDELRGKVEVEVAGLQKSFFCERSRSGGLRWKCWKARAVATRPRGVRSRNPNWRRYGS